MSVTRFIRIHNKAINVDMISYIDFLDSGRAMIFMNGLSLEKQNITVDPDEARKLKAVIDSLVQEPEAPVRSNGYMRSLS